MSPRKKRWLKIGVGLLVLAVLLRFAAVALAPSFLNSWFEERGYQSELEDLDVSLLTAEFTIERLRVREASETGDGAPLLELEFATLDVDVSALLTGTLRVKRAEVDGLDLYLDRDESGAWNFDPLLDSLAAEESAPEPEAEEASEEPAELDFSAPLELWALRGQNLRIHVDDRGVEPPIAAEWIANASLSDLGHAERPARIEAVLVAAGVLDAARMSATLETDASALEAHWSLELSGFEPAALRGWLTPLGLEPGGERLDAGLGAHVTLNVEEATRESASGEVVIEGVHLAADSVEQWAADRVEIPVVEVASAGVVLGDVRLRGLRGRLTLAESGAVGTSGLTFVGAPPAAPEPESEPEQPAPSESETPFAWSVASLHAEAGKLVVHDARKRTDVALELASLDVSALDSAFDRPVEASARLASPGVFELADVRATLTPEQGAHLAAVTWEVSGIAPSTLAAWLEDAGVESTLSSGVLKGALEARVASLADALSGNLALTELSYRDGEELLALGGFRVDGWSLAADGSVEVEDIEITGARITIERDEAGAFRLLGLRTLERAVASPATPAVEPRGTASSPAGELPRVRLGRLKWNESSFAFRDLAHPERDLVLEDFDLELRDLALGQNSQGSIAGLLAIEGVCDELRLQGSVSSEDDALQARLALRGSGIRGDRLMAWLEELGLGSDLVAASARADLDLDLDLSPGAKPAASLVLSDVAFEDQGRALASLAGLRVENARFTDGAFEVDAAELDAPRLAVARDAGGTLHALGLRLIGTEEEPSTPEVAVESEPAGSGVSSAPPAFALGRFEVRDGALAWRDESVEPAVDVELGYSVKLGGVDTRSDEAATFETALALETNSIALTGSVLPDPAAPRVATSVRLSGLAVGSLAGYLPPGVALEFDDGTVSLDSELELRSVEEGGFGFRALLSDLQVHPRASEPASLALERVELSAPRIDLAGGRIALDQVTCSGLEALVERDAEGALHAAGLVLSTPARPAPPADAAQQPAQEPTTVSFARRYDEEPLPRVTLEKLDLALAGLTFAETGGEPLTLSGRLSHAEPLVLVDRDPDELPPLEFTLEAAAEPVLEGATVALTLAPWEDEARILARFEATGISGPGVSRVLPALPLELDGMTGGRAAAELEARLLVKRRNPLDFDLQSGFGAELALRDVRFDPRGDGEDAAGFGALDVTVKRFDPGTGELHVTSVDLADLYGKATLSEAGPSFLGIRPSLMESSAVAEAPPAAPEAPASAAQPMPEVRVDELYVHGLDFVVTDERTEPPTVLPFDRLDVELKRFTTLTFTEARPFRFGAYVGAGKVSLPKPKKSASAVLGFTGAALSRITGRQDEFELEERPAFGEIAVSGNLALGPQPKGRVNLNIDTFELLEFSGLAKQSGVDIGGGVLDAWVKVRLKGEKGASIDSNFQFANLSLDEPPDGPISRYLKLPAPLDTVLFALQNQDGEHRIPASFSVSADGISASEVARVAVTTLGEVFAAAIASAPLRVAGELTGMLGLDGGEEGGFFSRVFRPVLRVFGLVGPAPPKSPPVDIVFESGETGFSDADLSAAGGMLEEIRDREGCVVILQHGFGSGDVERAELLANPGPEECRDLAAGLRRRKSELGQRRTELAAEVAAAVAVRGAEDSDAELRELREIDAELGRTELALDEVLALLRPGAERHREKRVRRALDEIATARMEALAAVLVAELGGDEERVEVRRARPTVTSGREEAVVRLTVKVRSE